MTITQGDQLNRLKLLRRQQRGAHNDQKGLVRSLGSSNRAISGPACSHKQANTIAHNHREDYSPPYENLPDSDSETGVCTRSQTLRQSSLSALVAVGRNLRTSQRVRNSTGLFTKPLLPPRPKDIGGRNHPDPAHTITVHIA